VEGNIVRTLFVPPCSVVSELWFSIRN